MPVHLYPVNPATDLPRLTELLRDATSETVALRRLREWHAGSPSGRIHLQVAAVESGGRIVGFAEVWRDPGMPAGRFQLDVVVDPARRGQGIGGMLYDDAVEFAWEQGATSIAAEARDDSCAGIGFAERRGFSIVRHIPAPSADDDPFEDYYGDRTEACPAGIYHLVRDLSDPASA
jgi:GNAT superfamily N-acetyltransferase